MSNPAKKLVKNAELSPVLQKELDKLVITARRYKKYKKHLESLEKSVLNRLQAEQGFEDGDLFPSVEVGSRKTISWKEVCKQLAGEPKVIEIEANAPEKPSKPKLKITKGGVPVY